MDAVALREIPRIEKRIQLLSTIANLATLLGLLGTIGGMIGAFASVANAAPAEKAAILAAKISESMNCTAFGLIIAVPLLGAYGAMHSWATSIVDDIHEASVSTLNFILSNRNKLAK
jgi:biopolymer transport protein ExbB/TolQ